MSASTLLSQRGTLETSRLFLLITAIFNKALASQKTSDPPLNIVNNSKLIHALLYYVILFDISVAVHFIQYTVFQCSMAPVERTCMDEVVLI